MTRWLALGFVACAPAEATLVGVPVDGDGDGAVASLDCDDQDPSRFPGASDLWGDLVDADCDGIDGAGTLATEVSLAEVWGHDAAVACGATLAAADFDGDGRENDLAVGCPLVSEFATPTAVYVLMQPSRREVTGEGHATIVRSDRVVPVGSSLNVTGRDEPGGVTLLIGDGPGSNAWFVPPPRDDVDLADAPPDFDCVTPSPSPAFVCAASLGNLGMEVHSDLTGDGTDDLTAVAIGDVVQGTQGLAWWAELTPDLDVALPDGLFTHGDPSTPIGALSGGDLNGDGVPDLLTGVFAPGDPEALFLVFNPVPGTVPVVDLAIGTFTRESETDDCCSLAGVGDLDADGYDDLLAGASFWGEERRGRAYVLYGPLDGARTLAAADAVFDGPEPLDQVGLASFAAGDLDGDGESDLAVAAPQNGYFTQAPGHVFVFSGAPRGALSPEQARVVWVGEPLDGFGQAGKAVDTDGDGDTELWVSAPNADVAGYYGPYGPDLLLAGKVYLLDAE